MTIKDKPETSPWHRLLETRLTRRSALGGEPVRVGLTLQCLPARIDAGAVLREAHWHTEKLEVVGLQVHGVKRPPTLAAWLPVAVIV